MTTTLVSQAKAVDVERAIGVVALAFAADPICRWAYPDAGTYVKYFPPFIKAFAGGAFEAGTAFVSDDYAGVALWMPPGVHADEEELGSIIEASVSGELREKLFEMVELQAKTHPDVPHWYLPMIGVDPAHQRQGHGSQLMTQALEICDREGMPAYLEATSRGSRALYERHGFEVVTEIQVADSPPMWPMLRRPRR
jgi:ribosomal protein S18 acetylase RimI-like enzyme